MSKELVFHCPRCKNRKQLEEVRVNAVISVPIERIEQVDDTEEFEVQNDYGRELEYDSVTDRYQCIDCGYPVKDEDDNLIQDDSDLVEWLKKCPENKGVN